MINENFEGLQTNGRSKIDFSSLPFRKVEVYIN